MIVVATVVVKALVCNGVVIDTGIELFAVDMPVDVLIILSHSQSLLLSSFFKSFDFRIWFFENKGKIYENELETSIENFQEKNKEKKWTRENKEQKDDNEKEERNEKKDRN